jgi:hypothetical protein
MVKFQNKSNTEVLCDNELNQSRFKTLLYFLRLGGIPLQLKSPSKLNNLYKTVCVVCYYSSFVCGFMDTFVHRHDLNEAMKKLRVNFAMLFVAWMHFSLRYVLC